MGKSVDSSVHVSLSFFLTRAETLAVLQEAGTELQAALSKGIFDGSYRLASKFKKFR